MVLLGLLIAGCAERPERTREATELAEQYLFAVAGGADDRGWSLLHPDARRDMFGGSMERYINSVLASDWTTFKFSVESVVPDDPSLYLVQLRTSPPGFLVQPGDHNLQILANAFDGAATMAIRLDTFARGVWPSGG
jgi:hypothetical protein